MDNPNEVKIFIFAGQSNMYGKQVAETFFDSAEVKEKIYYSYTRPANRAEMGVDVENEANFGPEYGFIKTLQANGVDNFTILKTAWAGSSITQERPFGFPDWHPDSEAELFEIMVNDYWTLTEKIIEDGGVPVLEGFFWSQGGGDRKYLDTYEENLTYFFDRLQEELQQRIDVYFLDETHATEEHLIEELNGVREIQHKYSAEHDNVTLFETEPYSFVDGLHFDASSQYDMGALLARDVLARHHEEDGDIMYEAPENVFFDGDNQNFYVGTSEDEIVFGFEGDDLLDGNDGIDHLIGDGGNDTLYGRNGDDYLHGGVGDNILYGGLGNDTLLAKFGSADGYGGAGNDTFLGWLEDDRFNGGVGNDIIEGGDGNDELRGSQGQDMINGGAGNDTLFGGTGDDEIRTGSGDDYVRGGAGSDTIILGEGTEQIAIHQNEIRSGTDTVIAFDLESDSITFIQGPAPEHEVDDLLERLITRSVDGDLEIVLATDAGDAHFLTLAGVDLDVSIADLHADGVFNIL